MNPRIGFYIADPFHEAMVTPVFDILRDKFHCLLTADRSEMVEFRPDIIVLADHYRGHFYDDLPDVTIVWTRHGFASKNYLGSALKWCDYACVSSEWVAEEMTQLGGKPRKGYWATGFTPMDRVYQNLQALKDSDNRDSKLPTVLWAPTFSPDLNSVEPLGWFVPDLVKTYPNLRLLIKPHPHVYRDRRRYWLYTWNIWSRQFPNVELLGQQDHNIHNHFHNADILVTDVSSVLFFYLAMNRPMILVNNPLRFSDLRYEPRAFEWVWRDMGYQVENASGFFTALEECLVDPGVHEERRLYYRERVFGNLFDGKAAERIASKVSELIRGESH